jgi:RNA polymerase sigma-70 factor (ECF subfamily)
MRSESELVELAKAGDMQSFQKLVEVNSGKMYAVAFRILHNKELAEDCVQEAFLKMYLKLDTFKQQSKFSTWLYSVTVNEALDILRKNAKHRNGSEVDFDQMVSGESNSPEKAVWVNNLGEVARNAVSTLSGDVRVAFILRHYEERSIKEITQILGINESTAKSRIFRGVARLRTLLQPTVGNYETVD